MPLDGADRALDALRDALREPANVRSIARDLLGKPTTQRGHNWRWGRKGSLSIWVGGARAGLVRDHEAEEGGDLLWFIMREKGRGFGEAVEWARSHLRLPVDARPVRQRPAHSSKAARVQADAADEAARIARARTLWHETVSLSGTLGERYLTEVRKIPVPETGWPGEVVRYHRGHQALCIAATDGERNVRAVQMVYLAADATKRNDVGSNGKLTYGAPQSCVARLPAIGEATDQGETLPPLLGTEGPETGLSVWGSTGLETWITFGSMSRMPPLPVGRLIVACADDDPEHAPAAKLFRKAVAGWRSAKTSVVVAWPWERRCHDKTDFNDVLKTQGGRVIQARIQAAIEAAERGEGLATVDIRVAEQMLTVAIRRFVSAANAWTPPEPGETAGVYPPPVHAIKVGVGIGKTIRALLAIVAYLRRLRRQGDRRSVGFAVPRHMLGEEVAAAFRALPDAAGLKAAVWRGRTAPDPAGPDYGNPKVSRDKLLTMCRDPDAVRDAQRVGAPVESSVCRRAERDLETGETVERTCGHYATCPWQAQKQIVADLWVFPHELIYHPKPKAFGQLALLFVDESAWQDGLEGVQGIPLDLSLEALRAPVSVPSEDTTDGEDADATAQLNALHRQAAAALEATQERGAPRQAMIDAGITAANAAEAVALTWRRKLDAPIWPGMPKDDRKAAVEMVASNALIMRMARFWRAVEMLVADDGPQNSGWLTLATAETDAGPQRVVRLTGRRDVAPGFQVPTLLMDAILDIRLVRPYWRQAEVTAAIEASIPNTRIRQLSGSDIGRSSLVTDDRYAKRQAELATRDKTEIARRERKALDAYAIVLRELRRHGGRRCLAVAQAAVEEYWKENFTIPTWLDLAHHNGVAGSNKWQNVPGIAVCGRTAPRAISVEIARGALTGEAVEARVDGRWPTVPATIHLVDGTTQTVDAECHPDALAEAIRWQVCEGELIQIVGRGRGVRREAHNPLEVLLLTDRPLPLPVELVTWDQLEPSPRDLMLASGGVAFDRPGEAAAAYPKILATRDAAKKAFARWREKHPMAAAAQEVPEAHHGTATYQRAGAGRSAATLEFDPAARPDLAAWLEARLGETDLDLEIRLPPDLEVPAEDEATTAPRPALTPIVLNDDDEEDLPLPPVRYAPLPPWAVPPSMAAWPAPQSGRGAGPPPTG